MDNALNLSCKRSEVRYFAFFCLAFLAILLCSGSTADALGAGPTRTPEQRQQSPVLAVDLDEQSASVDKVGGGALYRDWREGLLCGSRPQASTANYNICLSNGDDRYRWFWLSPVIVFLGILVNSILFYLSVRGKKRERRIDVVDGYWFRQVIAPDVQEFAKSIESRHRKIWKKKLKRVKEGKVEGSLQEYLDNDLAEDLHRLVVKLRKLRVIDEYLLNSVEKLIDDVEGKMTEKCFAFENASTSDEQYEIGRKIIMLFDNFNLDVMTTLMPDHLAYNERQL